MAEFRVGTAAPLLDLINADGLDAREISTGEAPIGNVFMEENTLSQVVLNASVVSFNESRLAQRASNQQ